MLHRKKDDNCMKNWKEFGRKRSLSNFKMISMHSPGGTEEYHEKP
jgi:hypothetical protein